MSNNNLKAKLDDAKRELKICKNPTRRAELEILIEHYEKELNRNPHIPRPIIKEKDEEFGWVEDEEPMDDDDSEIGIS